MTQASRPGRYRRRDFENSRRRLLAATWLFLAQRGPEALTVSEVAQRAGLDRSTAYQHFRSRDALAAAVTAELGEELTSQLAESQPLWDNLEDRMLFLVEHPELSRLFLQHLAGSSA